MQDLLAPSLVAKPGQVHPTEVAQLITFRSPQQAAARSALLAALTYDVRAQAGCRLLSVQDSPLGVAYRSMTQGSSTAGAAADGLAGASAAAAGAQQAAAQMGKAAGWAATLAGRSSKRVKPAGLHRSGSSSAAAGVHGAFSEANEAAAPSAAALAAAAMEKAVAEEAAAAMAAAMAALEESALPVPMHKVPLQPMVPTDTLAAACSDSSQQQQICMDGYGSVQFQTHMFYKLPHLAKLAAAAAAADEDSSAEAATCSGASGPLTAAPADAVGDAELQACAAVHGPGSSAGDGGIAGGSVTALAASAAEYIQQLKLAEVG